MIILPNLGFGYFFKRTESYFVISQAIENLSFQNENCWNHTRYIIERHGVPQVIILSFDDFAQVLDDESERQQMESILRELRPEYHLGQVISSTSDTK